MIIEEIKGVQLMLDTSSELFSPDHVDKGTLAMLSQVELTATDKVLDLGCGYGVVGITAAKIIGSQNIVTSDISEKAVHLSKKNAIKNNVGDMKLF